MPRSHHENRRNFFSQRVVESWNLLPAEVREAAAVSQFKRLYTVCIDATHRQQWHPTLMDEDGDEDGEEEGATQPEHPHRGPGWIIEDHLPSIPK